MDAIERYIVAHPYIAGGFIVSLFLLLFLYHESEVEAEEAAASESSDTVSGSFAPPSDAQVEASAQIEQAQIASQTQLGIAGINADVSNSSVSAQLQTNLANANVQAQANTINGQVTEAVSALQAQVAENQTNAGVQTAAIQATAYENIADEPYMAALAENEVAADVTISQEPTNADIETLANSIANLGSNVADIANSQGYDLSTDQTTGGGAGTSNNYNVVTTGAASQGYTQSILSGLNSQLNLASGGGSGGSLIPIQQLQAPVEFDANTETGTPATLSS